MSDKIKRSNDELKADRPTLNELKTIPRLPISIFLFQMQYWYNILLIKMLTSTGIDIALL